MARLAGVNINRLNGGLGRRAASNDSVFALVSCMPLTALNLEEHEAVQLHQLSDAEALGIDPAYDANKEVLAHHHISEVFRLAPDTTLFVIGVEPEGEGDTLVKDIIDDILPTIRLNKEIKGIGFVGFDDSITSIANDIEDIQSDLVGELAEENRFIDFVLLEGKTDSEITSDGLPDLRAKNAPQCSVVIAQDEFIRDMGDGDYDEYAAVGSALGMIAVRAVNENIGSVNIKNKPRSKKGMADYPLTWGSLWLTALLSSGEEAESYSKGDLDQMNDKGYIYAIGYEGYAGIYFRNSPTATDITSDYAYIENNRVWNKAARLIRQALIPVVKSTVKKDPQTGFIRGTTISYWESLVNNALEAMVGDDEISGFEFYIDPKQIVNDESPVVGKALIVADGIVHEFDIDLGLTNQIS